MTFCLSMRNIALMSSAIGLLALSACAAQSGSSRYGDSCAEPCMPAYPQQSYMETYYQVPVAPLPAPMPAPLPAPAPPVIISTPPAISCPGGTVLQVDSTCLETEQPVYISPVVGYTPDPIIPPRIYEPIRK